VVRYGGRLRVLVDGVAVADAAVSLPRSVLVGFTAGTGSRTDRHVIGHIRAVSGPAARVSVSAGQGAAAPAVVTLTTSASLAGRSALKSASIVFGDGTHWASLSSPTASVAHVYGFAGTYAATAYVADVAGHTSKATVTVHVAAPTGSALPAFTDSGWLRPGSANSAVVDSGSRVTLTPDAPTQQGQVWWHSPVASDGLTATFTSDIAGAGTPWADGMTFGLLDGTADPATAVGSGGGGLGLGGLPGAGVVLDTFDNATGTNVNIVAVATSDSGGLVYLQPVSSAGPSLHNATHRFDVAYRAGRLQLREDGVLVRDVALSLPSTVIVGFTAATGGYQERHSVTDVTIRP
jgi:hypothetical protein